MDAMEFYNALFDAKKCDIAPKNTWNWNEIDEFTVGYLGPTRSVWFRVPKSEIAKLKRLNLTKDANLWERIVRRFRNQGGIPNYDIVEGPMLKNVDKFIEGVSPVKYGQQTSWHTQEAIDLLMRGLN